MRRRQFAQALALGIAAVGSTAEAQAPEARSHVAWVMDTLIQMTSVKAGMTRSDLLKVFTTEGGISTGLKRTYVSRDCPYFKVNVEFRAVGRPATDARGAVTLVEDDRDVILKISQPYLGFMIQD